MEPESIFIYFEPGLALERDELEDAIGELLGQRGEVTGGGAGITGSNIDLELLDAAELDATVSALVDLLTTLGAPPGTRIVVPGRGTEQQL